MALFFNKSLMKKGAVAIALSSITDVFVQKQIQNFEKIDYERTFRLSFITFSSTVTFNNVWLMKIIPKIWRTSFFKDLSLTQKALFTLPIDFALLAPINVAYFIWMVEFLKNGNFIKANEELYNRFYENFRNGLVFWPVVTFCTNRFVSMDNKQYA